MVKVNVMVKQLKIFFDAEGGDKGVNRVADRDAKLAQSPVIPRRCDGQRDAAGFKECELAERIDGLRKPLVAANTLQHFTQNQAGDPDRLKAKVQVQPIALFVPLAG